ncbi:PEP-CTERM sorting domain-containing protein [Aquincola sp. MAHUQ-54]|uniref:PEP-CTERM sorting domain-containing protein n=1 Tax=Aquincola agrisoli TaxID=3119538 RepID=A0AAW9QHI1_9BURK
MKSSLIAAAAAALTLTASLAQATVINSAYTPLGNDAWLVDFTILNDGTPASFAGFTIDLPNATNLVLVASPSTWDSMVFQPDAGLADDGFFDSFVLDAANSLAAGQSLGGFKVSFTYTAGATPGALPFIINSENFTPLFAGTTTVTAVPEPATALMAAFGLGLLGLRAARTRTADRKTTEVTA